MKGGSQVKELPRTVRFLQEHGERMQRYGTNRKMELRRQLAEAAGKKGSTSLSFFWEL